VKRRGVTLIELVIAIAIVGLLSMAITRAFVAGIDYETKVSAARERIEARDRIDDRLTNLFHHAYLSPNDAETNTFFIAGSQQDGSIESGNATDVQFTVQGERIQGALLASQDDFETINQIYGPPGGIAEIALSLTAVGDPGTAQGLFIRTQRPADSEPTQGGVESVLDPSITSIEFEFWDGTAWQPTWSTLVGADKRLPAAVRITYSLEGESADQPHVLVVQVPNSDVTADNPAQQTAPGGAQ